MSKMKQCWARQSSLLTPGSTADTSGSRTLRPSLHEIWSQNKLAPPPPRLSILVIILSAYSRFLPSEVADFKLSCTHSIPAGLSLWQSRHLTLHWQPWPRPVRLQGWEESCTSVLKEQFDRSGKPSANFPGFPRTLHKLHGCVVRVKRLVWFKTPTV